MEIGLGGQGLGESNYIDFRQWASKVPCGDRPTPKRPSKVQRMLAFWGWFSAVLRESFVNILNHVF